MDLQAMDREFVREQLTKLGYKDLTDELIDEFLERLQEDDDLDYSYSKQNTTSTSKESTPNKQQNKTSPEKTRVSIDDNSVDDYESKSQQNTSHSSSQSPRKQRSPKRNKDDDDEITEWTKRIQRLNKKAKGLDLQIEECRSAIMDPPTEHVDVPLYFGTSERKLDPYPSVPYRNAGFIRPPPIRSSRKGIKKKGRKLLYNEKFPDYVPPPERRRDALRWQIRQKLVYSDPKYRQ
ncbi:hypothetical protein GPJ56_005280 [Histomonas meleagridis]|uniref:uncharacterized protein n=1 Tax=Histomonas meleagridis TaxID=135588 RepID=UPI003559630C|nr:hypothetical protein GPJ56_005280 [Histomonas meleagridis]KAH0802129.1 hypothetical protein GO595_005210 [Histomonas meleagridis]